MQQQAEREQGGYVLEGSRIDTRMGIIVADQTDGDSESTRGRRRRRSGRSKARNSTIDSIEAELRYWCLGVLRRRLLGEVVKRRPRETREPEWMGL